MRVVLSTVIYIGVSCILFVLCILYSNYHTRIKESIWAGGEFYFREKECRLEKAVSPPGALWGGLFYVFNVILIM